MPAEPVRAAAAPEGILIVDKPAGWTSHDVVARIRRLAGTRRVGHAGTLDPMATGVLVVGLGRGTRLLGHLSRADKDYAATIRLGVRTRSDDADGEPIGTGSVAGLLDPADGRLAAAVAGLTGAIRQRPSAVSAIKVDGVRAHARVRAGEDVDLPARPVTVAAFEVIGRRPAVTAEGHSVVDLDVRVSCSSGTYVRALARDLGAALGSGGHLTALRRTRVGAFGADEARTLAQLAQRLEPLGLGAAAARALPCWTVPPADVPRVAHGIRLPWPDPDPRGDREGPLAMLGPDGRLLALAEEADATTSYLAVLA